MADYIVSGPNRAASTSDAAPAASAIMIARHNFLVRIGFNERLPKTANHTKSIESLKI
ncbi:MAG TPA: hypothetical protein VEY92_00110 [Pseudoxanthomonas sp.]|nr:hypothetical protein [Pseudoxanthomonas sp.]